MDEQEVKAAEEGTVTTDAAVTVDSEEVQGAPDTGDNGSGDSAAQQGNDAGVDNVNVEDEQQGNTADMEEQAVPTQPDDSTAAGHVDDHDDDHDDDDGDDANSGGGSGGGADNGSQQQDEASAVASASAEAVATDDAEDTNAQSQQSSSSIVGQAEARRAQALERLQLRKKRASEGGDGMAGGNEADGHETGSGSNNRGDTDDSSVFVANGHGADSTGHADGARQQHSNQQQQEGRGSRTGSVLSSSSGTNRSRTASTASGSGSPSIVVVQNKGPRGFMKWLSGTTDPQKQAALQQQRAAAQRRAQLLHEAEMETHRRQRANLLNMSKIAVKTLIESSVGLAGTLTETHRPLHQLLLLLEKTLSHGVKAKQQGLWRFFDVGERHVSGACADIIGRSRAIASYRTNIGRARFCLRTLMMEQLLSDLIRVFSDNDPLIAEVYHPWAVMAGDGCAVLSGLLMGLNVLQIQLSTNADLLDTESSELDLSLYLKEGNYLRPAVRDDPEETSKRFSEDSFNALTDQNATLREVNKKYQRQIEELSAEVDALKSELASSQATIASLRDSKEALADAVAAAKKDADTTHMQCTQKLAAAEQDMAAERKTYDESRSSLNAMMDALQKQLDTERELREEVENDRAFSKQQQQEAEEKAKEAEQQMAAQEETVVHLRKQLKEVKGLNLKMLTNLQELQGQVKDEQNKCHAIQQEKDKKAAEIQTLQSKLRDAVARRDHMEAALTEVGTRLKAADGKRVEMETALTVERQWRQSLQQEADRAAEKLEEMEMVRSQLVSTQDELRSLQTKHDMLQQSYRDQEKALLEMGERLSETALQVDRFEAQEKRNRQKQWADDSEIKHCQACERSFGVKRRKHHCRGCGGIFCDECSDNRMPLPSYAKPVRVCDTCEKDIIAKMTAPH